MGSVTPDWGQGRRPPTLGCGQNLQQPNCCLAIIGPTLPAISHSRCCFYPFSPPDMETEKSPGK